MITLRIDEVEISVPEETTILIAAQQNDIYIPHLCSHPDLPPVEQMNPSDVIYRGQKRLKNKRPDQHYEGCQLCVVEIKGQEGLHRACHTTVAEGMVIQTTSPKIDEFRRNRLMFLFEKHPHACLTCAQKEGCARFPCSTNIPELERCCSQFGRCEFQKVAEYVGIKPETPRYVFEDLPHVKEDPLFIWDANLCIGCTRCIRVCREVRGVEALGFIFDEEERVIVGTLSPTLRESACRFCTACVEVCPTGALMDKEPFEEAPCRSDCPVGIDVPRYVRLIAEGKFDESYAVIREKLPLPSVCSYICLSYCENECRRGEVNESIGIRALKRFVSENHSDLWKKNLQSSVPTGKKVAVVGSGPAGLTAAYYLSRKGHETTIFEQASLPGGMLRQGISKKRLPSKALDDDIKGILETGMDLKLNAPRNKIDEILKDGFDAVFLATGSTFVGPPKLTQAANQDVVFVGGDAVLPGISEDFIHQLKKGNGNGFYKKLIGQISLHRGDSSRAAIKAIASGREAAECIDKYLGGDGDISECFQPPGEITHWLGREECFADLNRLSPSYKIPPPQFAGLWEAEPPLNQDQAIMEAKRCLRCELRLLFSKPILPPKKKLWTEFIPENVAAVPEVEGIYQLLDEKENVIYIKGTMNLHKEIVEQLETNENAHYFMYEQDEMFTKKESELLQQYITEHGEMPEGNRELDDLF